MWSCFWGQLYTYLIQEYANKTELFSDYLRTCLLRGLRFLPTVDQEAWREIVLYSLNGSTIERLLATETWLYLRHTDGFYEQAGSINAIKQYVKQDTTFPNRLIRNYILLLRNYGENIPLLSTNQILELDLENLAKLDDEHLDVFEYQEPEIIRAEYYSSLRQGDNLYY